MPVGYHKSLSLALSLSLDKSNLRILSYYDVRAVNGNFQVGVGLPLFSILS